MTNSNWIVDLTHSSIDFSVKHMMIAKVKGTFHDFKADIMANPQDLTNATISFEVNVESVDTRNTDRDNHLRSADFFDTENHPKMTFVSSLIERKNDDEYLVTGDLTIRGVTLKETFSVVFEGEGKDPWGNLKVGFSAKGKINRSDYGLTWNAALETGGVLVSDEIAISLEIQASQK